MRRTILQQGQLGEVPVPKLGRRTVIQALETPTRKDRECEALGLLYGFHAEARERAAFRLLREARRRHRPRSIDAAEVFNLTGRDQDALQEMVSRVNRKLWRVPHSLILVDEQAGLADEKGPIVITPDLGQRYWEGAWSSRGVNLVVLFVPANFDEKELLLSYRDVNTGLPLDKLFGRSTLLLYLVARGSLHLRGCINLRRMRRLVKKWGLLERISYEEYVNRVLDLMREP